MGCSGHVWQVLIGISIFGSYSICGTGALFDRIVANSGAAIGATCTFLIFCADCSGYVFSIALLLYETFSKQKASGAELLDQFKEVLWVLSAVELLCLFASAVYFKWKLRCANCSIRGR